MKSRIIFVLLLCSLSFLEGLSAVDKSSAAPPSESKKTIITGDKFVFNPLKNLAVYEGGVVVIDPQMDLLCDKLTIHFEAKKKVSKVVPKEEKDPEDLDVLNKRENKKEPKVAPMVGLGGNIDSIIAEGDVEIINKKDKTRAVGGHAVYSSKTEVLVLTNNPKLFTKQGVLLGRIIEYNRKTGELLARQAVLENREIPKAPIKKPDGK